MRKLNRFLLFGITTLLPFTAHPVKTWGGLGPTTGWDVFFIILMLLFAATTFIVAPLCFIALLVQKRSPAVVYWIPGLLGITLGVGLIIDNFGDNYSTSAKLYIGVLALIVGIVSIYRFFTRQGRQTAHKIHEEGGR